MSSFVELNEQEQFQLILLHAEDSINDKKEFWINNPSESEESRAKISEDLRQMEKWIWNKRVEYCLLNEKDL